MRTKTGTLGLLGAICLAAALPARGDPGQFELPGKVYAIAGTVKVKLKRIGSQKEDAAATLSFAEDNVFTLSEANLGDYSATYTAKPPKCVTLTVELDEDAVTATELYLEELIEEFLAGQGLPLDVTVTLTKSKIGAKVQEGGEAMKLGVKLDFTAEDSILGQSTKGSLKIKMKGPRDDT